MDSDSDFYGDEETVSRLQLRVDSFDMGANLRDKVAINVSVPQKQDKTQASLGHLHNPYAGVSYAWQLDETVDGFLARLPPATTEATPDLPWIYICNPFIPREPKTQADNQYVRGCEDEAPLDFNSHLAVFLQGGMERLHLLRDFAEKSRSSRKPNTVITREISKERDDAVAQILDLAHFMHVRSGKWMLFPEPTHVNEVWETVARATANNELGIAAKVAPRADEPERRSAARLICIYTKDFRDKDDIARVLNRMRELELVKTNGKPIYYKCDAYTYLGVSSDNAWKIRASLYSSRDIFAHIRGRASGRDGS